MSVHTKTAPTKTGRAKKRVKVVVKEKSLPWREAFKQRLRKHSEGGVMLKGCRSKADITQKDLAEALSISQHHISEMENGKRPIGKEMAKRLAKFFETDYRVFL
ncbi:MAG: helix-turn-helix transcriptional regulator [Chlamydiae bacterium]|nr:helix-turn-helix transcriptional regulator [Chlamydiota bacterium]